MQAKNRTMPNDGNSFDNETPFLQKHKKVVNLGRSYKPGEFWPGNHRKQFVKKCLIRDNLKPGIFEDQVQPAS
jgi:hypothetical protein